MVEGVRRLREEARRANERRVVVCAGGAASSLARAGDVLEAADVPLSETTVLGSTGFEGAERLSAREADRLLGRTRTAVVVDAHESFRPNALGAAVGAVDGGGLLVLCTPPLATWPDRRDEFDESLAVPPATVESVAGHFRRRVVDTLRVHPGIAIHEERDGTWTVTRDGLTDPPPRLATRLPGPPASAQFPQEAYGACLTADQVAVVHAFETLRNPGHALVVEADRGRGKSSAAGLAAGSFAREGLDVLVAAPTYDNAREVFARARSLLACEDGSNRMSPDTEPTELSTVAGRIRFERATEAAALPGGPDLVIVDEAAAVPVRTLEGFLEAPRVAFTTTVHGYEGTGRGFAVRFRDRLEDADLSVATETMTTPVRYAPADPVESWAFRALVLDARPAVDPLVASATPETVAYGHPTPADLSADEHVLREVVGLLALAHYRTEPDDVARILDAPNVSVRTLTHGGHVASVALLAREGGLSADRRSAMYEGARVRGNMIPDVLTTQLRDVEAGVPVGYRVLRIATHPAVRSRGLGTRLIERVRGEVEGSVDWLGVGFGATPDLVRFWAANGFRTVHLSTTRNDASGEYSAVMLDPLSPAGEDLATRHTDWFLERIGGVLSDPLEDLDPDVARAALRAVGSTPTLDLSPQAWRHVEGIPTGASTFDTAPDPVRRLALCHLVDPGAPGVGDRQERLLVCKVLQGGAWDAVADRMGFVSTAECMRTLARTVEDLAATYREAPPERPSEES